MNNREIMIKAYKKAKTNGYILSDTLQHETSSARCYYADSNESLAMIFSHNFAKTFWGEEPQSVYGGVWNTYSDNPTTVELYEIPVWQYHLQQMVLESDPVKYLERFL